MKKEIAMLDENHDDFYQKLRKRVEIYLASEEGKKFKYAEYLLLVPDMFHLLCRLSLDKNVAVKDKAKLAAALAYFISPIDFIPELPLGPIGYVDDLAIVAYVLNSIINNTDPEIVLKHWSGKKDLLEAIKSILEFADEMVGSGLWRKIKNMF